MLFALQIYGKENKFNAARLIDLLGAYETFREASQSARGSLDQEGGLPSAALLVSASSSSGRPALEGTASIHGSYRPISAAWPRVSAPSNFHLSLVACLLHACHHN